jgi:hypothetical protein
MASRYALFTLVRIAGEDDIDAPDLKALPPAPAGAKPAPNRHSRLNGSQGHRARGMLTFARVGRNARPSWH